MMNNYGRIDYSPRSAAICGRSAGLDNQQLAGLYTRFGQNVLAEENDQFLVLKTDAELAGLSASLRDAAAQAATTKKMPGSWVIMNTRSAIDPFLTYSDRRDLGQKAWRIFVNRGDNGDEHDNNRMITEILQLRAERAKLLGFPTHAHWRLQNTMARTPERATELMEAVWKPAVARVHEEVADMQALADKEGSGINITFTPLDECLPQSRANKRGRHNHRLEQCKLREGKTGRTGTYLLGRRRDDVSRVRSRAPRSELERHLPVVVRGRRSPATTSSFLHS